MPYGHTFRPLCVDLLGPPPAKRIHSGVSYRYSRAERFGRTASYDAIDIGFHYCASAGCRYVTPSTIRNTSHTTDSCLHQPHCDTYCPNHVDAEHSTAGEIFHHRVCYRYQAGTCVPHMYHRVRCHIDIRFRNRTSTQCRFLNRIKPRYIQPAFVDLEHPTA